MTTIETIRAEIKRRLSLIYLLEGYFTDGSRDAYEGLLSWLDTLPEQPASEDLEKEIADYIEGCLGGLEGQEIASCARYFYDLGCRRTAEMYDEIEYKRQSAEEAELSEELDAEMDKYFESMEVQEHENIFEDTFHKIARHFAEFGMNQCPLPEDTTIFQKGVAEGKRLMMESAVGGRYMKADGEVYVESWPLDIDPDSVKAGDEVKLIVIPEEK